MANHPKSADHIFRRRALDRQGEQEPIDAPLRVTAPHEWVIATGLALALAVALAWGVLGRVPLSLQVDGAVVQPGDRGVVATAAAGRILDLLVEPGDSVAADAPVARLERADGEMRLRLARAAEASLASAADQSANVGPVLHAAIEAARVELLQIAALQGSGGAVVTPRAGEISAVQVDVGEAVAAGAPIVDIRYHRPGPVTAVALLDARQAARVRPGMPVRLRYDSAEGAAEPLQGAVLSVSEPRTLPRWLEAAPIAAASARAPRVRLVTVSVEGAAARGLRDLAPIRIEIVLDRIAPLRLLGPG